VALIKCTECGKEISDLSDACIGCGCPLTKMNSISEVIDSATIKNASINKYTINQPNHMRTLSKPAVDNKSEAYDTLGANVTESNNVDEKKIGGFLYLIMALILGELCVVLYRAIQEILAAFPVIELETISYIFIVAILTILLFMMVNQRSLFIAVYKAVLTAGIIGVAFMMISTEKIEFSFVVILVNHILQLVYMSNSKRVATTFVR